MVLNDTEKLSILKIEFPNLSFEEDADIERYYQLRKDGYQKEALNIYNAALKRKFPDDSTRIKLLHFYRSRDPGFPVLLRQCLISMADLFIERLEKNIDFLTRDTGKLNINDAYSVIKTTENLISSLSPSRHEAVAKAERYTLYARMLKYKEPLMEKTALLIRQYVNESVDSVENLKQEQSRAKRAEEERKKAAGTKPLFDLSKIHFSKEDIKRIEIPGDITREEDKVLAYCTKYWTKVSDAAFERTIFLYSRKYNTKHYEVFQEIKFGRLNKRRDGDILTNVLGTITTGYFYSVQGDIYLQNMWRRIREQAGFVSKPEPETAAPLKQEAKPEKDRKTKAPKTGKNKKRNLKSGKKTAKKTGNKRTALSPAKGRIEKAPGKDKGKITGNRVLNQGVMKKSPGMTTGKAVTIKPDSGNKVSTEKNSPVDSIKIQSYIPQDKRGSIVFTAPKGKRPEASISDYIKNLSGKSYDVYKDLFMSSIVPFIRKSIERNPEVPIRFFGSSIGKAEETVYKFLTENYDNPFLDWNSSEEKKKLDKMGYRIDSVYNIVSQWFKSL